MEPAAPRILITRPEPGASQTAEKLRALGFEPVVVPFTQMVGLPVNIDEALSQKVNAIVVTSANALRYLPTDAVKTLCCIQLFAVGDATADAARALGFTDVISADGNASDLYALVLAHVDKDVHLLYLCGATRTLDIEESLLSAGLKFSVVETYKTEKISQLTDNIIGILQDKNIDGVCFYSSVSARIFNDLFALPILSDLIEFKYYFCISARAKNCLPSALSDQIFVCDQPRDDAMIRLISSQFPH